MSILRSVEGFKSYKVKGLRSGRKLQLFNSLTLELLNFIGLLSEQRKLHGIVKPRCIPIGPASMRSVIEQERCQTPLEDTLPAADSICCNETKSDVIICGSSNQFLTQNVTPR